MQAEGTDAEHEKKPIWERLAAVLLILGLPLGDLAWNLTHLNIGLVDFYALAAFARGFAQNGAWPATPYFPAGYPLLLAPWGLLGERLSGAVSVLTGGYVLSACGLIIALWALYRLTRELGLQRELALLAVVLGWAAPVYRSVAGSPSVDALYTGLGLWFIAAALTLWRRSGDGIPLPRWAALGLWLCSALLPLLRYHAVLLLLPVLAVLLIWRPATRRIVLGGVLACSLALGFNYGSYYLAYGKLPADAAVLQVRCGLEFELHKTYAAPELLFADYRNFSLRARATSLLADYTPTQIARHLLGGWYHFLRQPSIALAIVLLGLIMAARRPEPVGAVLTAVWITGYTLALSAAYYTPRAAALPVLVGVALALSLAAQAFPRSLLQIAPYLAALLLLAGYSIANQAAQAEFAERQQFAHDSVELEHFCFMWGYKSRADVVSCEWRLLPLSNNPWCEPYGRIEQSWLDDTEIRAAQIPGLEQINVGELAKGETSVQIVILHQPGPDSCFQQWAAIFNNTWLLTGTAGDLMYYELTSYFPLHEGGIRLRL